MTAIRLRTLAAALVAAASFTAAGAAQALTLEFATTVSTVSPSAPGFPSSLAGITVGTPVTGTLTYNPASPEAANPFSSTGSFFGLATYYPLPGATFAMRVGNVTFDSFTGGISAFVADNQPVGGPGSSSDGLIFINVSGPTGAQFQVGNIGLGSGTFASDALPAAAPPGLYVATLGNPGSTQFWLQASSFALTQPVPEPSTYAMLAAGLLGALWRARRRAR